MNTNDSGDEPLRGVTPPGWSQVVKQAQQEAVEPAPVAVQVARTRRPRPPWLLPAYAAGIVLAGASLVLWLTFERERPPDAAELDQGRRALLALVDDSLEQHLKLHGEYPETLEAVLPLQVQVVYRRVGKGYELDLRLSNGESLKAGRP